MEQLSRQQKKGGATASALPPPPLQYAARAVSWTADLTATRCRSSEAAQPRSATLAQLLGCHKTELQSSIASETWVNGANGTKWR